MLNGRLILKTKYLPSLLFALIALIVVSAFYHSDSTLIDERGRAGFIIGIYALLGISILFLIPHLKQIKINIATICAIMTVIVVFILNTFSGYNDTGTSRLVVALWIIFCLFPKDLQLHSFKVFKKIWIIICLIGIICYLCYIFDLPIPYEKVSYYFGAKYQYINYGLSFLYETDHSLRLCGICNEPGYFGTICALLLCVNGVNLKEKSNIIIMTAGLLTFSAAFVMMIVIYFMAKLLIDIFGERDKRKKIKSIILCLMIVFSYCVILPQIKTGNEKVDFVLHRITITSDGIAGDNRTTEEFDEVYGSLSFSELIFGKGRGYLKNNDILNNLSYKIYILEYGVVGSFSIWGLLLFAALYGNTKYKNIVLFVIVFFASVYQRPIIITLPYLVILMGGIECIRKNNMNNNIKYVGSNDYAKK